MESVIIDLEHTNEKKRDFMDGTIQSIDTKHAMLSNSVCRLLLLLHHILLCYFFLIIDFIHKVIK